MYVVCTYFLNHIWRYILVTLHEFITHINKNTIIETMGINWPLCWRIPRLGIGGKLGEPQICPSIVLRNRIVFIFFIIRSNSLGTSISIYIFFFSVTPKLQIVLNDVLPSSLRASRSQSSSAISTRLLRLKATAKEVSDMTKFCQFRYNVKWRWQFSWQFIRYLV